MRKETHPMNQQMKTIMRTLSLALAASATLGGAVRGQTFQTDRTVDAQPGMRLQVENHFGRVTVRAWDRPAVRVQASHPSDVRVEVDVSGSLVQVEASHGGKSVEYVLTVPADMPLEIDVVQGEVDVSGTRAGMQIQSVNGAITVHGGDGSIDLGSVQGSITLEGARGEVHAESVNGRIQLRGIDSGRVTAETVNGAVSYEGSIRSDGWYRFSTHNGGIDLTIPANAGATFTASTFNGTLVTGFPVTLREAKEGKEFSFTLGSGGARIELETFNGTMSIRRPGQP
ncbi:MAG TPA: hypothetical protein VEY33_07900 [Gemmatimonadota bacterium]|nr:hypothetical protein [Gemmatimonadota bacterium]